MLKVWDSFEQQAETTKMLSCAVPKLVGENSVSSSIWLSSSRRREALLGDCWLGWERCIKGFFLLYCIWSRSTVVEDLLARFITSCSQLSLHHSRAESFVSAGEKSGAAGGKAGRSWAQVHPRGGLPHCKFNVDRR